MGYQSCKDKNGHRFSTRSGWCLRAGCLTRDDGRTTTRAGAILHPGPTYNPDQLEYFKQKARP